MINTERTELTMNSSLSSVPDRQPIAIIGMGCRFPGDANDPSTFWQILSEARDVIQPIPDQRWSQAHFYHPRQGLPGRTQAAWAGLIDGIDRFDPRPFGISPREASRMDPQQRMVLETAWEALEDGGQVLDRLAGSDTAVFVGISSWDYTYQGLSFQDRGVIDTYSNTGGSHSIAANRISYCFDFRGPSSAVDTACSSALLAIHFACRSIWNGDSSLALAGGVNALLLPDFFVAFSQLNMLSPTGRCRAFDASADGFVRSEGAGMVLLKPLDQAIADHDRIYAVIRGTAVNQDGRTPGMTVPSQEAQEKLVAAACRAADIEPRQIDYVEAHGTGTLVGDPIEARALGKSLGVGRRADHPCILGSVKTNIGHLEAGAGVASLMKVALAMHHECIPPNLHFQKPNPEIDFGQLGLHVPTNAIPWPRRTQPRWAGINGFGYGGTNVHVILQDAPPLGDSRSDVLERRTGLDRDLLESRGIESPVTRVEKRRKLVAELQNEQDADRSELIPLSAQSLGALEGMVEQVLSQLDSLTKETTFRDWVSNAVHRRSHLDHRLTLVAGSFDETKRQLQELNRSTPAVAERSRRVGPRTPRVAFVCSGQGPQWWAMGRELLDQESVFRNMIRRCDSLVQQLGFWSLWDELTASESESRMADTAISQPAIFAIQVALAEVLRTWGVHPVAVAGHSVGEVAAAYLAGVFPLDDAVRIIYQRGRCMGHASTDGGMLAAGLTAEEAGEILKPYGDEVTIAAVNSPTSLTLSGNPEPLEAIAAELTSRNVFHRRLHVEYAFHSSQMDPIRDSLLDALQGLRPQAARIPMYSTVSGKRIDGTEMIANYWWHNVRDAVHFAQAMERLREDDIDAVVELSPHPVLAAAMNECFQDSPRSIEVLPTLRRGDAERNSLLQTAGALFRQGFPLNWHTLIPPSRKFISFPRYAWQRDVLWYESDESRTSRHPRGTHPLLGTASHAPGHRWENRLDLRLLPYLSDHRVEGTVIFPATGFVEIILAAAQELFGTTSCQLEDLRLISPLIFSPEPSHRTATHYHETDGVVSVFSHSSQTNSDWNHHGLATIRKLESAITTRIPLREIQTRCSQPFTQESFYQYCADLGLDYGIDFQGIQHGWRGKLESLAQVRLSAQAADDADNYLLHPALLDACFQTVIAADDDFPDFVGPLYLPVSIDSLQLLQRPGNIVWAHARIRSKTDTILIADVDLLDDNGQPLAKVRGLTSQRTAGTSYRESLSEMLYEYCWQACSTADSESTTSTNAADLDDNDDYSRETIEDPAPVKDRLASRSEPQSNRPHSQESWLLFSDQRGVGDELARRLLEQGARCQQVFVRVGSGPLPECSSQQDLANRKDWIDAASRAEMQDVVGAFLEQAGDQPRIVHLWNLDAPKSSQLDAQQLEGCQDPGVISLLHFVQAWDQAIQERADSESSITPFASPNSPTNTPLPPLWIVTAGAQSVTEESRIGELPLPEHFEIAPAPVLGLGRGFVSEYGALTTRLVDLEPGEPEKLAAQFVEELTLFRTGIDQEEDEIAWRGGARYVHRFMRLETADSQVIPSDDLPSVPFCLGMSRMATLDGLEYRTTDRQPPRDGEVEIAVRAAALNFSDVMKVLGLYPGKAGEEPVLGAECSGVVTRVGKGVAEFRPGDEVVAVAPHSFASHVTTKSDLVAAKPTQLTFEQAATLPIAFLTARYAMEHLGRLQSGERVLIHSASGGVGLAAIQLARLLEAEIFATAGSEEKRTYLKRKNISHVMDSRSLTFADEVLQRTNGEGVDMILNSLAGKAITRGMEVLADYGRFLEIGKRDIYRNMHLGLKPFRKNLSFFGIDLDQVMQDRPQLLGRLLRDIVRDFEEGHLQPLPLQVFEAADTVDAFRWMQQGKHIGKVVISFASPPQRVVPDDTKSLQLSHDATYLITGGLGGFGMAVARWLILKGARHLVLVGRSGAATPTAQEKVEQLEALGAQVTVCQGDIACQQDLEKILQMIRQTMPPLRGVYHAAMILEDGLIQNMDRQCMLRVMAPKVRGGWNLHLLTQEDELEHFVLFSSLSSVFGHAGQANYSAANAFLDQLAHFRRINGLPCLTVNWGYLEDVGYLAERPELGERLRRQGILSFTVRQALDCLQRGLLQNRIQLSVMNLNWSKWRGMGAGGPISPRFRHLLSHPEEGGDLDHGAALNPTALRSLAKSEKLEAIDRLLCEKVSQVLGVSLEKLDRQTPLLDLGLDSLMAVELRNWIEARLQVNFPIVELVRSTSLTAVIERLCERLSAGNSQSEPIPEEAGRSNSTDSLDPEEVLANLDQLSSDEVDQLLTTLLDGGMEKPEGQF